MFVTGQTYVRRDLHTQYGGQSQGGISTPTAYPIILLFTGEQGEQYIYSDGWTNDGVFLYTGEGKVGDMEFMRGNRAILQHAEEGKDLHQGIRLSGSRQCDTAVRLYGASMPMSHLLLLSLIENSLSYLSLEGLRKCVKKEAENFCYACFTGDYAVPFLRDVCGE